MQISQAQIKRVVENNGKGVSIKKERLDEFVAAVNMWSTHYGINTERRMAHFLSQVMCESAGLKYYEENLNYSAEGLRRTFKKYFKTDADAASYARKPMQIANRVYANRYGNGDEASGDGWRFRGRGLIMLTFRANYKEYGNSDLCIGNPVLTPDIISKFPEAYKSAMWFWQKNGLNQLADKDTGSNYADVCTEITKVVNGGTNGLETRLLYLRRFKKEFGLK